ncbi:uncharacterized protein LOC115320248 [Ixodes scapularis]|uniref:uncharacterized protein LOC115320248 n=1 Tax=Ixodes scapularis TaxID=6945 RepID=UPI001A9E0568|nr:uncharacterized protein LOC115320248 [Ixodes scapularis]
MPTVYLLRECSTRCGKTNDIRFHKLPDDPQRRSAWLRAIDRDGPDDIGRSQGYLCSHHFLTGDYDMNIEERRSLGLETKRGRLKPDAVPTQHLWFDAPPKKRRSENLNGSPDVVNMTVEEGPIPCRTVDGWTQTTKNAVTALRQTDGGDVQTQFTQASFSVWAKKTVGVQTDTQQPTGKCRQRDSNIEEVLPENDRKFIVFETSLKELFRVCRKCDAPLESIKKKLAAQTKRAGCGVLEVWIQPASSHLFWCAAICDGSQDLLVDMWRSIQAHVINIHEGHPGLYTHCVHDDLRHRMARSW